MENLSFKDYYIQKGIRSAYYYDSYLCVHVYRRHYGRFAVLKKFHPRLNNTGFLSKYFERLESVADKKIDQACRIFDFGTFNQEGYVGEEYVPGTRLSTILDQLAQSNTRPPLDLALISLYSLAKAIKRFHEQGIMHGGISPRSIFIPAKLEFVLTDFHLAATALSCGIEPDALDRPFMAPEILAGQALCRSSDIYSVAALGFYVLANEQYHVEQDFEQQSTKILRDFGMQEFMPDLLELLKGCLVADPGNRLDSPEKLYHKMETLMQPYFSRDRSAVKYFMEDLIAGDLESEQEELKQLGSEFAKTLSITMLDYEQFDQAVKEDIDKQASQSLDSELGEIFSEPTESLGADEETYQEAQQETAPPKDTTEEDKKPFDIEVSEEELEAIRSSIGIEDESSESELAEDEDEQPISYSLQDVQHFFEDEQESIEEMEGEALSEEDEDEDWEEKRISQIEEEIAASESVSTEQIEVSTSQEGSESYTDEQDQEEKGLDLAEEVKLSEEIPTDTVIDKAMIDDALEDTEEYGEDEEYTETEALDPVEGTETAQEGEQLSSETLPSEDIYDRYDASQVVIHKKFDIPAKSEEEIQKERDTLESKRQKEQKLLDEQEREDQVISISPKKAKYIRIGFIAFFFLIIFGGLLYYAETHYDDWFEAWGDKAFINDDYQKALRFYNIALKNAPDNVELKQKIYKTKLRIEGLQPSSHPSKPVPKTEPSEEVENQQQLK